MYQKGKGVGQEIYSGAASFGRGYAIFSAIMATVISLILIGVGIWLLFQKDPDTKSVQAKVDDAQCTFVPASKNSSSSWSCLVTVTYEVDGKKYTNKLTSDGQTQYQKGQIITIHYNPQDPQQSELTPIRYKLFGGVTLGIGLFIILASWGTVWLTRRYKAFAAVEGASGLWHMFR